MQPYPQQNQGQQYPNAYAKQEFNQNDQQYQYPQQQQQQMPQQQQQQIPQQQQMQPPQQKPTNNLFNAHLGQGINIGINRGQQLQQNDRGININLAFNGSRYKYPTKINCDNCHQEVISRVQYTNGDCTWIMSGVLCFCFFPLACMPFCIKEGKNCSHYCPICGKYFGMKTGLC